MIIDLYTTHCPRCSVLEKKLEAKNIQYYEHDNVDEMLAMGFKSAPVLLVDGQRYNFQEAVKFINSLGEI